ncbi:DUF397 domain-containing protein [Streptomyces boncukensis]|uniref:DUF397 domain-containing protein n=1 Tax=Streptomyces boncukensis TaxID=2711219 RepID=A0A6G4WQB2_9ACTN|nr:DUF397 domain-containing protein [Streptomyces boncukensis]NGO67459.1 DUF397 domain-containing protein [Streptomyces boncukensis]
MYYEAEALRDVAWFTSTYSDNQGGECVECASLACGAMAVRDSKNPHGPAPAFGRDAWSSFVAALGDGTLGG